MNIYSTLPCAKGEGIEDWQEALSSKNSQAPWDRGVIFLCVHFVVDAKLLHPILPTTLSPYDFHFTDKETRFQEG